MTPSERMDAMLPALRASLRSRYSEAAIDRFLQRNRAALEQLVGQAVTLRRLKRGALPKSAEEFSLFSRLAAREQKHDAAADADVLGRVARRVGKMIEAAKDDAERDLARRMEAEYTVLRAEAILLRHRGWEAVPLLLRRPSLAIYSAKSIVMVHRHDPEPTASISPDLEASAERLLADAQAAHEEATAILAEIPGTKSDRIAMALWARARAMAAPAASTSPVVEVEVPPDHRTKVWRTEANLRAMHLAVKKHKAEAEYTPEDLAILAQYSGWGGLSIEEAQDRFPEDLQPETFGLIHEYYTPTVIAEAIVRVLCPFLPTLTGNDGVLRALEPSAGIGRLIRAFTPRLCLELEAEGHVKAIDWTAVEFSTVSALLLEALRPDVTLYHAPFERWIREEAMTHARTFGLVVANPPYGERGPMAREDPDPFYAENRAYAYFMRRALDLLIPGGIGVFLIPAGFLSGMLNRGLREKLLLRHHLLGAYRLPSHGPSGRENVPGASVVMDVVFWQSRGGELTEIDDADLDVLEGRYFERHPGHILGVEDGSFRGDDETGKARSWRYKVTGELGPLPPLRPRPVCTACKLTPILDSGKKLVYKSVIADADAIPDDVDESLRPALELGIRVGRYLAAVAQEDERAAQLWPELHAALEDFAEVFGNPTRAADLRALAEERGIVAAQRILGAFTRSGEIAPSLRDPPKIEPRYTGQPDDVVAQAEAVFRQQRRLNLAEVMALHRRVGGGLGDDEALEALLAAEWNLDGDRWDELWPADAYLTGSDLWAKHDRARARADAGDEQAATQVQRLLRAIEPAVFEDIADISPHHGYVPLDLVGGWLSDTLNRKLGPVTLEREGGFVQIAGKSYLAESGKERAGIAPETLMFLGLYNHDPALFKPPKEKRSSGEAPLTREERAQKRRSLAERRMEIQTRWADSFKAWLAADEDRRERFVNAYNRGARGKIVPTYSSEPLEIARWGPGAPKLRPHQIAGARRLLAQRGGIAAFDVGVGKTHTGLAFVACARQQGWARRPVLLVPGSLVWKWHDDILCTLPDYRVAVIGSKRKRIQQGPRKGLVTSEPDTPEEQAQKWMALQTGQVDVVVLSFDALARTRVSEDVVMKYISQVEAVERSIALRRRALQEKTLTAKQKAKLSERERALLEHGVRAWVEEVLALPDNQDYVPGITWDEIGIDLLVIDEAHAFKNLYMPQARDGEVPKFMGGGGEGSNRAWQLDFRAAAVRQQTGGAGVALLTATPAKNSPLEFYNLIQFIDPGAFTRAGIRDPEQFIDRFLKIEIREVLDSMFEVTKKPAVTGFKNLDDLRTLILTYTEFRTAEEVGLKLPRPVVETITIKMNDAQEAKYEGYVKEIEEILKNPDPGAGGNAILGLLARLSAVALHPALDAGYNFKTALHGGPIKQTVYEDGEKYTVTVNLPRPAYESPKLIECAKRVAASPHCGHVIFCESTAVHQWMRELLVEHGIPRERIAILNADAAGVADRVRIAKEFNGLSSEPPTPGSCARPTGSTVDPKYDAVIANRVAGEGLDLQVRTCTLHHLDLTWTPADLEQRNGRAVRQGNTLGVVHIYYYFADGSTDGYRFGLIDGKATWLGELLTSQVRDTNNPAAQQQLTPEDILLMISRDKEKTRAMLEEKKRRQVEDARAKVAKEAARLLRQAAARLRKARESTDPEKAARLREEAEQRLTDLEDVDQQAWPWAPWMYAVRDQDVLIPEDGGAPVYEGLRVARPKAGAPDQIEYLEFGRIVPGAEQDRIGLRAAGSPSWQVVAFAGDIAGAKITPEHLPREGGPMWPEDDDARTGEAIERKLDGLFRFSRFDALGWRGASEAFLEKWWPVFEKTIGEGLAASPMRDRVPVVDEEGLVVAVGQEILGAEILPPSRTGWQRFLELSPKSGESYDTLRAAGITWWGRSIPKDLLAARGQKDEEAEKDEEPEEGEAARDLAEVQAPPERRATEGGIVIAELTRKNALDITEWLASSPPPPPDDEADRNTIDHLTMWVSAQRDALMMGGASQATSRRHHEETIAQALNLVRLRAEAMLLRGRGYDVRLHGGVQAARIVIHRGDDLLAVRDARALWVAPGLSSEVQSALEVDVDKASARAAALVDKERPRNDLQAVAEAVWKQSRAEAGAAVGANGPPRDAAKAEAKSEPSAAVDDRYEEARRELRALRLPGKQHGKFLRQLDAAIATRKSTAPILARARKAAEKLQTGKVSPARTTPEPSTIETIIDNFNAAPHWRLVLQSPRPNGYVFSVYPEGGEPEDAVATIEVLDFGIDRVDWLAGRLSQADQDEILARLDRALWVGVDVDEMRSEESRSPIQDLIEAMERRAPELGANPQESLRTGRKDGYATIAEAMRDFSSPAGMAADDLERWLKSHNFFTAADLVARSSTVETPIESLLGDLWSAVLDHFRLVEIRGEPGRLRVPHGALAGEGDRFVLLAEEGRPRPWRVFVLVRGEEEGDEEDDDETMLVIDDPAGHLQRGSVVYVADGDEELLADAYQHLADFESGLRRAPKTLEDVRTLLYWATAMLDAPRCQGEVKRATLRAIEQARAAYAKARALLAEGQAVRAVQRMHAALRRISAAAAELARACAEGQQPLPGVAPTLEISPEDADAIGLDADNDQESAA